MSTYNNLIDFNLTVNDLLTPGISRTIYGAEPSGRNHSIYYYVDLFPNTTYTNAFTSVESTFKIDDEIVFFYFDEAMSAGTGNIVISSDTDTRHIDVNDTSQVIFGTYDYIPRNPLLQKGGFGVVTINPSTDLLPGTVYTIQVANGVFVDSLGNQQPGFNNASFETIDSTPRYYPFNEVYVPTDYNIELHFDETVKAGTGDIVISDGIDIRTVAIDDVSQVTFEDDIVTINLADDLLPGSTYVLEIKSGVITDEAGHPNTDLLSAFYETAPATPQPVLNFSNPYNGSPDFKSDDNIELRFSGAVKAGVGSLVLSNGTDTRIIAIDDKNQVTFDGCNVIINPTEDLISGTTYTAQMASGVITDKAGNPYAGFMDATFSTIDSGPVSAYQSGGRADNFKIDQDIRLFFDEEVTAGNGNIIISDGSDIRTIDAKDTDQVTFDRNGSLIIDPTSDLNPDTTYTVQISDSAITDTNGNTLAAGNYQIILATSDSAPLYVGSYPNNGGSIKSDQLIVLRFDEKIIAGSGDLVLSNGTDTRSIAMTDSSQVTFTGRSVIIDPNDDLVPGTIYTANMASGVITDSEGNPYSGFSDASFTVEEISLIGLV